MSRPGVMNIVDFARASLLALFLAVSHANAQDEARDNVVDARPLGPLDGNWRVTRSDDPFDAALLLMQIRVEGRAIKGDYVLFQPFCGVDLPAASAGAETCEFDGVTGDVSGQVRGGRMTLVFRPGADGAPHRLVVPTRPRNWHLEGRYLAPGETSGIPVRLARPPE